jgi:hypothetical protein
MSKKHVPVVVVPTRDFRQNSQSRYNRSACWKVSGLQVRRCHVSNSKHLRHIPRSHP